MFVFSTVQPTALTSQTMMSGSCYASLSGLRTRERLISCPTDRGIPGSGTAVTSESNPIIVSPVSLCSDRFRSYADLYGSTNGKLDISDYQ